MLSASQIRTKYLKFFESKGHKIVPSSPLIPENDPTTLFTGSGMQPMLPYLLGQPYSEGTTRIVDSQKCFRSQDIEEVGDNRHDTFFEMLGNWSLGDYFKSEQITWIFEFFTNKKTGLGLDPNRLYVSVFRGQPDINIPKDTEAVDIWKQEFKKVGIDAKDIDFPETLGMQDGRIFYYDAKKNWWSRSGVPANMPVGEPGGPDSEIFYDFGADLKLHEQSVWKLEPCHPNCDCGRFLEIGNNVFMAYLKTDSGFTPLAKKNIDFGGGFERIVAAVNSDPDMFVTDIYSDIVKEVERLSGKSYASSQTSMRIIADHFKGSTFLIADGVRPSNKAQGYFLRRILRRAMVKLQQMDVSSHDYSSIVKAVVKTYSDTSYFEGVDVEEVIKVFVDESTKFSKTLKDGLKKLETTSPFDLFQTYGFPIEITEELYKEKGLKLDRKKFDSELKAHQDLSRTAGKGMFKGGLQDQSEITTKYHTATHLLHAALRNVLGTHVQQKGSNITSERLRFDFSHSDKLTQEQIQLIEQEINAKISENITVTKRDMKKTDALAEGALAFFPEKYPDVTSVYQIGSYSKELCGGPHVNSTGDIGRIKITKEESAGAGIRRIYAQLEAN